MSTNLPGSNPTAYLGLKETNPPQLYFRNRAPLATDSAPYDMGDIWIDQTALEAWILVLKIGPVATWVACAGAGAAETLTGDAGGAVGPDGTDNINILGNSVGFQNGIQFTGTPAANTLTGMDLRNITVYVVDAVAGQTEYQTVQAALDAANADGGGTVYVRPGTYTEDLTLYDAVDITAAVATPAGYQTTIVGSHTPPATGAMSFRNLALIDTTDILNSNAAGTTTLVLIDCITEVANGYTLNLPNWTGLIAVINVHCQGTEDGFIDIAAGAADLLVLNSTIGVGTANAALVSGTSRIVATNIQCDFSAGGQGFTNMRDVQWIYTLLFTGSANALISHCTCIQDVDEAINNTSAGLVQIMHTTIESSGNPDVISGTGTVQFGSVLFTISAAVAAGITLQAAEYQITGPIEIIPSDSSVAAEDAWIKFDIPGVAGYSLGIDNSDADNFKLTTGATPSAGTLLMNFEPATPSLEIPIRSIIQSYADAGNLLSFTVSNLDNTNVASGAALFLTVGGANADDVFTRYRVAGAGQYSFGIDNTNLDNLKITDGGNPSAGNIRWQMTTAGERTMPTQPAFAAQLTNTQANATGDSTQVNLNSVAFTEFFDQNADFDAASGVFTAPVTGRYLFNVAFLLHDLAAAHTSGRFFLFTTTRIYEISNCNVGAIENSSNNLILTGTVFADMTATDTAYMIVTIANGAKVVDVGNLLTQFSGYLVC